MRVYVRSQGLRHLSSGSSSALPDLDSMPGCTRTCTDTQGSKPSHATTFVFTKYTHFHYSFWQLNAVVASAAWRPQHLRSKPGLCTEQLCDLGQLSTCPPHRTLPPIY